ncbi:MAG: VOC family protein [Methylococcaceae bacterium]|jgi:predicted 3-demethylubiquinone-9 3-methyltransferase (glyoxalase superfamily)
MQKIIPFLWFDNQAEEAMNFYVSIFKNSKVLGVNRCGEGAPASKGTVMTANFQLEGQAFTALNGGPMFKFTPAISFVVHCEMQAEVDESIGRNFPQAGKKINAPGWMWEQKHSPSNRIWMFWRFLNKTQKEALLQSF